LIVVVIVVFQLDHQTSPPHGFFESFVRSSATTWPKCSYRVDWSHQRALWHFDQVVCAFSTPHHWIKYLRHMLIWS